MVSHKTKQAFIDLLASIDIKVGGDRPWDIRLHGDGIFERTVRRGSVGTFESYMYGEWECDSIDQLTVKVLAGDIEQKIKASPNLIFHALYTRFFNLSTKKRAFEVGQKHYDTGNDLYRAMLDKRMVYTCAYWKKAKTLDEAQEDKLDLVCRKLGLKPGMRLLDIGGGWGSLAKFAAERYGVSVVNVSVSREQVALANELCKGLPVENRCMDYRDIGTKEKFDAIASLGMVEHVGRQNYRTFMRVAEGALKDDGLFLLHTIGFVRSNVAPDAWVNKYIFPNSMVPSLKELAGAAEGHFLVEDLHNFGPDYDKTLLQWVANFEAAWPSLKDQYDEVFHRMWRLYLLGAAGGFRARSSQLWQIVFSKHGVPGGYTSVR